MNPFVSKPCKPDDALDAARPVEAIRAVLQATDAQVLPIRTPSGPAAVRTIDLRRSAHLGLAHAVGDLADDELLHDSIDSATTWLAAAPGHTGAIVADGASLTRVERTATPVRTAVVMAGGFGSRLRPLTDDTPKPLLEVGGRVLLYRILDHLQHHGFDRLFLSVHYLADRVRDAVGDGSDWGMTVDYLEEDEPLDTGAGLVLLEDVDEPFLIINGDILTTLNLTAFTRWHQLEQNLATIATYRFAAPLPYGVVHGDDARILEIEEKPVYRYDINAGVYAFSPEVLDLVEPRRPLAMVDFLNAQARVTERVRAFPIVEYWNDVGTHADFERAQTEVLEL
ncbi:MAG: NTP transferase domain-containing protein [Planctomycetes bacterium]|nr:NTP transferase domain-containing protein [Planctomycetota bacterium]